MQKLIKVWFVKNEFDAELIAEFMSESLLASCKPMLKQEAHLRECKVHYEYHKVNQYESR